MTDGETRPDLAAIDLGSNSFHMLIARVVNGEPVVVDRIREQVQLARGLDKKGRLSPKAQFRAVACLERFGQRLRSLPEARVRAVATNTLRASSDPEPFLAAAETALGHPIEVISGQEEARLIYLGVAHSLPDDPGPRLVIDIGGGSTECILGERFETLEVHSLEMGCVGFSRRFFPKGLITKEAFQGAVLAAQLEVQTIQRRFRDVGWNRAIGASGTIGAAHDVLVANGWGPTITPKGLKRLRKTLIQLADLRHAALDGLKPERAMVFAGGVAILIALVDALRVDTLQSVGGALREGVMYDLLGRIRHEDVRERTIRIFQDRYHVDLAQASRVERTALELLLHAADRWSLDPATAGRFLAWAARLHEIGLAVSYTRNHRHGAYLLQYADMPGFSRDDQNLLATIVRGHRRKVPRDLLQRLAPPRRESARRLTAILRLAVLLNRSRVARGHPPVRLEVSGKKMRLAFQEGFLEEHPLTVADLEGEAHDLEALGLVLEVSSSMRPSAH